MPMYISTKESDTVFKKYFTADILQEGAGCCTHFSEPSCKPTGGGCYSFKRKIDLI